MDRKIHVSDLVFALFVPLRGFARAVKFLGPVDHNISNHELEVGIHLTNRFSVSGQISFDDVKLEMAESDLTRFLLLFFTSCILFWA